MMNTLVKEDSRVGRAQTGASPCGTRRPSVAVAAAAPCDAKLVPLWGTSASLRVARMAQLEDLFRTDPNLLEDYFDQERAHQDYEAAISYSRAEGEERGIALGGMNMLFSLVDDGLLPIGAAAAKAGMGEAEFRARMDKRG